MNRRHTTILTALWLVSFPCWAETNPVDSLRVTLAVAAVLSLVPAIAIIFLQNVKLANRILFAVCGWVVSVFVIAGSTLLFSTPANSDKGKWYDDTQDRWEKSPIRVAACTGNAGDLRREFHFGQWNDESKMRILKECVIATRNPEILRVLLEDLQPDAKRRDLDVHCAYLEPVMVSRDVKLLDVFTQFKYPLNCGQHMWWYGLIYADRPNADQTIEWLKYLGNNGIDLNEVNGAESLLVFAIENLDAKVIHFALDLGIDPYALASGNSPWKPLQSWILRRYGIRPTSFLQDRFFLKLSNADIASVQNRLRELTATESNLINNEGHRFNDWHLAEDGGAGLFRYLVSRGANLELATETGEGMINPRTEISPQLLEVLEQLSDRQLNQLACPRSPKSLQYHSLYEAATKANNQTLVNLFHRRKLRQDCS